VLAAYVILRTINTSLVEFRLPQINIGVTLAPPSAPQPAQTQSQTTLGSLGTLVGGVVDTRTTVAGCTNCEILTGVNISSNACRPPRANCGVMLNTETAVEVMSMNQALTGLGFNMQVTEGWPPTVVHANICHMNGTCIDYNFIGQQGAATASQVTQVINTAQAQGLRAVYEVGNTATCQALKAAGVPPNNVFVVPGINNPHFSVYNPGLSNGNGQAC